MFLLFLLTILFISNNAFGVTSDTPGAIVISNSVVEYFGSGPSTFTNASPSSIVKTNWGLSTLTSPAVYMGPKTLSATFNYFFTNNVNKIDPNIKISLDQINLSGASAGTAANWNAEIWTNWNGTWGASGIN